MPKVPGALQRTLDGLDRKTLAEVSRYVASRLGHLGGAKGGKRRAARMTPEARRESARKAVLARWAKVKVAQKN